MNNIDQIKYTIEEPWFSFNNNIYIGSAPSFYDSSHYKWKEGLESSFDIIKTEVLAYLDSHKNEFDPYFNTDLVSSEGSWQTIIFKSWNQDRKSLKDLPVLSSILEKIPHVTSIALSKITAGGEISMHPGDTNTVVRCHFPITIPCGLPDCGFQVNEEEVGWKEGQLLMFCDAHSHRAFNHTESDRIILIFDFIREDFIGQKGLIIKNVLADLWIQKICLKYKLLHLLPRVFKSILRRFYHVIKL